jgi:hypothetical protein
MELHKSALVQAGSWYIRAECLSGCGIYGVTKEMCSNYAVLCFPFRSRRSQHREMSRNVLSLQLNYIFCPTGHMEKNDLFVQLEKFVLSVRPNPFCPVGHFHSVQSDIFFCSIGCITIYSTKETGQIGFIQLKRLNRLITRK